MNNKGFIATSLIYSFFLVFVAVISTIIATYAHNRILINNINDGIVDDLNTSIANKYISLENILKNSDFETNDAWSIEGNASFTTNESEDFKISYRGFESLKINTGNSAIKQTVNLEGKYYYARYYLFRNGTITGYSNLALWDANTNKIVADFNLNYKNSDINSNWVMYSNIANFSGSVSGHTYYLNLKNDDIGSPKDWGFSRLHVDSMMLVDVTSLIEEGYSKEKIKTYLDTLDYFEGKKSIEKP